MTNFAPRIYVPLADAVAPLRAKHRDAVRELAEWSLGLGRPIDLDVTALCVDVLEENLHDNRVLTRPWLNGIQWASIHNKAAILNTQLPDDWRVHFWTLLCWYSETGRIDEASDPLPALLEPLQCYGGLGGNGYPRPEGEDVAFVCQCYVPYDPNVPAGQTKLIIGRAPGTYEELFLLVQHPQPRSQEAPASAFAPLFQLMRHPDTEGIELRVDPLEWQFLGRCDETNDVPALWVYSHSGRRHDYPVLLDASGMRWVPHPDSRRKTGFRLRQTSIVSAYYAAASTERDREEFDARAAFS